MNFTFGITTYDGFHVEQVIRSIENLKIPKKKYEIIVIGGLEEEVKYKRETWKKISNNLTCINFDEEIKPGWFTKKKNIITDSSKFENIVYSHDYIIYDENWYSEFEKFGDQWDVCMNTIKNNDGTRYRDWCAWDDPKLCYKNNRHVVKLVPYFYNNIENMYISGAYWVAKKEFMKKYPLDENLLMNQSEDVEWSKRWRKDKVEYAMNQNSIVNLLKQKRLSALPA